MYPKLDHSPAGRRSLNRQELEQAAIDNRGSNSIIEMIINDKRYRGKIEEVLVVSGVMLITIPGETYVEMGLETDEWIH